MSVNKITQYHLSNYKNEHYFWGDYCEGWHLLDNPNLSVIREKMPYGTSERLHYHEKAQQLFYILSGTATFELNGAEKTVSSNETIYVAPKTLHNISNRSEQLLEFLLISQPKAQGDRIEILEFSSETKDAIKTLNFEWLNKYFKIEARDEISLSNPQEEIIEKGGMIFYASRNNENEDKN